MTTQSASTQHQLDLIGRLGSMIGTLDPNPGVQRMIGAPANLLPDPANNRVLGQPLCAIATVTSQVKTTNQVDFAVSGSVFRKAATDNFWTLTGGVLAISSWRKYLLLVDNAGAASVLQSASDSTVSAAAVVLPAPPAGKSVFGVATIATNGATTLTPGTTLLAAAGITTTFVDGLDAFYANYVPSMPTVIMGAASGATSIASSTFIAAALPGPVINTAVPWKYLCGRMVAFNSGGSDKVVVASAGSVNQSGAWYAIEFEWDGTQFEFQVQGNGAQSGWRMLVDGKYHNPDVQPGAPAGGAPYRFLVTFATRGTRHIRLEFSDDIPFRGLNIGPNDTAWQSLVPIGPRVIVFGDSFTVGAGPATRVANYVNNLGKLMGWRDTWSSGVGGSGYLAPGTGVKLRDRVVVDVINQSPDIVLIAAGYNDSPTFTPAQIGAEASLLLQAIRASLPNCKIMVAEQWSANGSPTQTQLDVRAAIQTALNAIAGPTLFIDTMVTTVPGANTLGWITGTGKVSAPTGSGNADLYVASDGIHPTQAGHDYYGRRFAAAISAAMPF